MGYFIIKLLDKKEEDLDHIDSITTLDHIDFLMTLRAKDYVCQKCGIFTHSFKDYITKKPKYKIFINFDSIIFYN